MHVTVLVPAPSDTISGGYIYDRQLVAGLRAMGHAAGLVDVPGQHPLADHAAQAAALTTWNALPADARPVIDGLALPAFAGVAAEFAARRAVALIHHPTALETGRPDEERLALRAIEAQLLPQFGRIITTSDSTAERLVADCGVRRERIAVIVPGTDAASRSLGSGGPECAILSVGTLVPRKGHDVLLQALARLTDLPWRLRIVGSAVRDPAHALALQRLVASLSLAARVHFEHEITAEALEALWQTADLFALATHWEGYGMAVAEALRRGLPVAITAGGAAASLVPMQAGVVCQPGDSAGLSLALRRLIYDVPLRRIMSDAAWQAGQHLPDWTTQSALFAAALATEAP